MWSRVMRSFQLVAHHVCILYPQHLYVVLSLVFPSFFVHSIFLSLPFPSFPFPYPSASLPRPRPLPRLLPVYFPVPVAVPSVPFP